MTTEQETPLCMTCGTKMRPAGSCYVCEGCGSTSGINPVESPDTEQQAEPEEAPGQTTRKRPRYKRIRKKDSWLRDRHDPTKEYSQKWREMGFPSHVDIVAGFLMSNNLVFGVPDKTELFRLDKVTREGDRMFGGSEWSSKDTLHLHYVQPSPVPIVTYTQAHPPLGMEMGDIVEVNYNVRLQALVRRMWLVNVRVLHGSEIDDSSKIVFEGTEYPGAAANREIRVVRITVHNADAATWEEVSKTTYPRSIF